MRPVGTLFFTRRFLAIVVLALSGCATYVPVTFDSPSYAGAQTRPATFIKTDASDQIRVQLAPRSGDLDVTAMCRLTVRENGQIIGSQCFAMQGSSEDDAQYVLNIASRAIFRAPIEPALLDGVPVGVLMPTQIHYVQRGDTRSLNFQPADGWLDASRDTQVFSPQKILDYRTEYASNAGACGPDDIVEVSGVVDVTGTFQEVTANTSASDPTCHGLAAQRIQRYRFIPAFDFDGVAVPVTFEEEFSWAPPARRSTAYSRRDPRVKDDLRPKPRFVFPIPHVTVKP